MPSPHPLRASYWTLPDTWTPPPARVAVAPDSWVDTEHLARVIAARAMRPYHPLIQEVA